MDVSGQYEKELAEKQDMRVSIGAEACRQAFKDGVDITINPYGKNNFYAYGWNMAAREIEQEDGL